MVIVKRMRSYIFLFSLQNLIFLEPVVEDLHKLTRDLFKVAEGTEQPTMKDVKTWLDWAKSASATVNSKFISVSN